MIPCFYTTIAETPDPGKLDDIPGIKVLDHIDDLGIALIELTDESSLTSLLRIRRRGYQLSHVVTMNIDSISDDQK